MLQPPPFAFCLFDDKDSEYIDTYNGIGKRIDHTTIVQSTATAGQVQQIDIIDNSVVSSPLKSLFVVASRLCGCCVVLVLNDVSVSKN